jgi:glycosyltransferase involved in cell wall biosynthesis
MDKQRRILVTMVGDVQRDAFARVKIGPLYRALERRGLQLESFDASLHWMLKLVNAVQCFHPSPRCWKERFWKNVPAFDMRSRRVGRHVCRHPDRWEAVLQLGVLFDAAQDQGCLPGFIFTDYTARMSAERPEAGRSPFTPAQRTQWLDREWRAYRHAKHIFTRSRIVRDSIINDYGIPAEKVTAIGGGVNFDPLPEPGPGPQGDPLVLFIGKEFHRKGGDILLEAFALARREVPQARLRMVTQGPLPAGLPLEGVEWIPPTWDRNVIESCYREASLFVLPSRLETWGDVLLEAMAFGLPCIGVEGDAMGEIIADGESGLLVPPQEPAVLAAALVRLLRDPALRERMGRAGRRRVELQFTWDSVASRVSDVLDRYL